MEQILSFHRGPTGGMYHGTDIVSFPRGLTGGKCTMGHVSFPRGPTGGNVPWDRYCVIPQAFHREEMCHAVDIVSFPRGPTGGNVPWDRYCVIPQGFHRGKCIPWDRLCHSPGVLQGQMYHGADIVSFLRGSTGGNVPWDKYCVIPQGSHMGNVP